MGTTYWFRYFFFIFILLQSSTSFGMKPEESDADIEAQPPTLGRPEVNPETLGLLESSHLNTNDYNSIPKIAPRPRNLRNVHDHLEKEEPPVIFLAVRGSRNHEEPWYRYDSALCKKNPKYVPSGHYVDVTPFEATKQLDTAFFQSMNPSVTKKQIVGRVIGAILAIAPAQMDVPSDNVALGNTFNWTYAGENTWITGSAITLFTTPIYMVQLGKLGGQIAASFDSQSPMKEFRNKKSTAHKLCRWALVPIYATVPTAVDVAYFTWLESGNWSYYGPIVVPGAFARFHRRVEIAQRPFDRIFYRSYSANSTNANKEVVYASIDLCKKKIRIDPVFRKSVFDILMDRYEFPEDTLRLGAMCLIDAMGVANNLDFQLDMYDVSPKSTTQSFLSKTADVIQGAAWFANLSAVRYTLENLVFGSSSDLWINVSRSIAVADSISKVFSERGVTIDFLTSYGGGLFSWPSNFPWTRKTTQVTNFANSALHSFPMIYLAQQGIAQDYAATSPYAQTLFLAPLALREVAYYQEYYNEKTDDLISGAARMRLRNASADKQQSVIEQFMKAYKREIEQMQEAPFSNYFHLFFKTSPL